MKQLFKSKDKQIIIDDVPAPAISDNEVLIEVKKSLISTGTEAMGFQGTTGVQYLQNSFSNGKKVKNFLLEKGYTELMRKIKSRSDIAYASGYSVSGIVKDKGKNIKNFEIGDEVAAAGSGYASHAEMVAVPNNLVIKKPASVTFEQAAFTTIGSIALHGVRQSKVAVGETVAVIGLGLIGLITIQILKAAGCKVIGIDIDQRKLVKALYLGIDEVFLANKPNLSNDILHTVNNIGVDSTIICASTESDDPVNLAASITRKKGRVVVVGAVGMKLSREQFYKKELEFTVSCSYGPGRYDQNYEEKGIDYPVSYVRWTENRNMESFLWMLTQGKIDVDTLISDCYSINDANKAFQKIMDKSQLTFGIILDYPTVKIENKINKKVLVRSPLNYMYTKNLINIAVIGTGGFAKKTYLPFIDKNDELLLSAVSAKTGLSAKKTAKEYGAEYCTTDYKEIIADKSIDAVIIATRHNLHYQMAYEAIMSGKHVLLEKPMGLTNTEVEELKELVQGHNTVFSVGYNRRYSPLIDLSKKMLKEEIGPMLITYRINAGFIPPEDWTQDPDIGGGRIIGEACHFIDLMNYLTGSSVEKISVQHLDIDDQTVLSNDNFAATLKYENGSLGMLIYTSLGNNELSKEKIEIFINGKSIVIDDFNSLKAFGIPGIDTSLKKQNKGHAAQFNEFIKAIQGKKNKLLDVNEAADAALTANKINTMINQSADISFL